MYHDTILEIDWNSSAVFTKVLKTEFVYNFNGFTMFKISFQSTFIDWGHDKFRASVDDFGTFKYG